MCQGETKRWDRNTHPNNIPQTYYTAPHAMQCNETRNELTYTHATNKDPTMQPIQLRAQFELIARASRRWYLLRTGNATKQTQHCTAVPSFIVHNLAQIS